MDTSHPQPVSSFGEPLGERLDCWKEIAAYLKRDERTVRRWEAEGLPVHRKLHKKQASVFAYKQEIDAWWNDDRKRLESEAPEGELLVQDEKRASRWRHSWIPALLIAALILAALASNTAGVRKRILAPTAPAIRSIAVLPLVNLSADPGQDYLADGMTEALIGRLSGIHDLRVISRTSVTRFKGTQLSLPEIARTLGVDAIVEGSVIREGSRIRVHAQLIRAATDEHFWSEAYDRELRDVLSLQSDVAQSIVRKVEVTITGEEHASLSSARTVDPEAYEAYLKGRYYWNKRTAASMSKATLYFEQAISKDPSYGAPYSGLADCNSGLAWHGFMSPAEVLATAYAAAQKAVEIDPQSAEAHASLALVLNHKWDWAGAGVEFKRALELDPQYANAHHWYGDYLSIQGQHDEALVEAKRALELDPLNLMIGTWVGLRYYLARRYDPAIEQSRNTVDLDPNFAAAHLILGESYVQDGKHKEGLDELQKAAGLSGDSPLYRAQVGVSLALAGGKREALGVIRELQGISGKRYISPYGVAQIYAALNDKEQTYKWLETAYRDRAVWMSYLAVDPVFDSIRSEDRFRDLLRRAGLANVGDNMGTELPKNATNRDAGCANDIDETTNLAFLDLRWARSSYFKCVSEPPFTQTASVENERTGGYVVQVARYQKFGSR